MHDHHDRLISSPRCGSAPLVVVQAEPRDPNAPTSGPLFGARPFGPVRQSGVSPRLGSSPPPPLSGSTAAAASLVIVLALAWLSSVSRNSSSSSSRLSRHRRPSGAALDPLPPSGSRETGEPPPGPSPARHRGGRPLLLRTGKSNQGESNRGSRGGAVVQSSPKLQPPGPLSAKCRADGRGGHSYSFASAGARGRDRRRKGRTTVVARPPRASTPPQPWPVLHRRRPQARGLAPVRGHNLGSGPLTRLIPHAAIDFS
jgi:hypothetical protein